MIILAFKYAMDRNLKYRFMECVYFKGT